MKDTVMGLLKWALAVLVIVVGGPVIVFAYHATIWTNDALSGKPARITAEQQEQALVAKAKTDPAAARLLAARKSVSAANTDLETATTVKAVAETKNRASETVTRGVKDYSNRVLVGEEVLVKDDAGKSLESLAAGTKVRYYPNIDPRSFPADTKIWVRVSVAPHEQKNLLWVPEESVGPESLDKPTITSWTALPREKDRWGWFIEVAAGRETPPLYWESKQDSTYSLRYSGDISSELSIRINQQDWEPYVSGMEIPGGSTVMFRPMIMDGVARIRVVLTAE